MKRALQWQLYVSGYTFFFGVPLLLVPSEAIALLGFEAIEGPWVPLTGMFLLCLSYISYGIYREKATAMLLHSIRVRAFITVVLLSLAMAGHPPFLYAMAAIVGIGVLGSTTSYVGKKGSSVA